MVRFMVMLVAALVSVPAFGRSPQRLSKLLSEMDRLGDTSERRSVIDQEAAQRDAWRSRLFWYTDLPQAIAAARVADKPILSLRLLGRLDEEFSCANSRFFRKTLYVDLQIAALLRSKYILHWESVRPVPIVTIDYGNGTVVKRTLTGNSIHYLLAPDGRVIDALPGLLDAGTFERELSVFAGLTKSDPAIQPEAMARYHDATVMRLGTAPAAHPPPVRLTDRAMDRTVAKAVSQAAVLTATRSPSEYVRADTVHNQGVLRPQILSWLRAEPDMKLKSLNERVYAELFITPLGDPLMGLLLPDEAALVPTVLAPRVPPAGNVKSR